MKWKKHDYHAQFAIAKLCWMFGWRFARGQRAAAMAVALVADRT